MSNFCYFTATTKRDDVPTAATMLKSARAAGVTEDFHLFAPIPVEGFTNHSFNGPWQNHIGKITCLRKLADTSYDYCVWLDADNYFVRHPGEFGQFLLRDNPCFVTMEGEITGPVIQSDWYGMRFNGKPSILDELRSWGCGSLTGGRIYTTNGGMFIVRRSEIARFANAIEQTWKKMFMKNRQIPDEPPLAIIGQTWLKDCELNRTDNHADIWICDWMGQYTNRLPDGKTIKYREWMTGRAFDANPAIVHAMRSKDAMRKVSLDAIPLNSERVGTKLSELFKELEIDRPTCNVCQEWIDQMDLWGIDGCKNNRKAILHRLAEASDTAGWLDMMRVVSRGYFSTAALLDEALKRAAP